MPHGVFVCSSLTDIGSACNLECEVGYQAVGETETECETDKTWSSAESYCESRPKILVCVI